MQNSSRKLGEFNALVTQSLRKSSFFVNNGLRKTLPLYFRALEDHHTCSAIHAKFGSGLTCDEQNVRYTLKTYGNQRNVNSLLFV